MKLVTIEEAQAEQAHAQLEQLVDLAAAGEEIIISRAGIPVARLVAIALTKQPRRFGALAGKISVAEDFDDPLPQKILSEFEGR